MMTQLQKNNGIPCICHMLSVKAKCHASQHSKKVLDPNDFRDSNGKLIKHNDLLRYTNPHCPEKRQPIHTAFIKFGDCWIRSNAEEDLRRARSRGRWHGERFTIINHFVELTKS